MKNILIFVMITSFCSIACADTVSMNLENKRELIRLGSYFDSTPAFVSFNEAVKKQLSQRMDVVFKEDAEFEVSYNTKLHSETFYDLFPKGSIYGLVNNRSFKLTCGFEVNDGGHITLKKSCAKKLARKIKALILSLRVFV